MALTGYVFVSLTTPSSTKQYGASASANQARAHAARFAHARKRGEIILHQPGTRKTRSKARSKMEAMQVLKTEDDISDKHETSPPSEHVTLIPTSPSILDHQASSPNQSLRQSESRLRTAQGMQKLPPSITKSALDPFFKLAFELSVPDQQLLHFYLMAIPNQMFGTASKAIANPLEASAVDIIANDWTSLTCLLLFLETQAVSFQPTPSQKAISILTRRASMYQMLSDSIAVSRPQTLLMTVYTMIIATMVEYRSGNGAVGQQAFNAAMQLLASYGGLARIREFDHPQRFMVVNSLLEFGTRQLLAHEGFQEPRLATMIKTLLKMQGWNSSFRLQASRKSSSNQKACHKVDSEDAKNFCLPLSLIIRRRQFAQGSALSDYVAVPAYKLNDFEARNLLGILYAINIALWEFRDNEVDTIGYLEELSHSVSMSEPATFPLKAASPRFPSLTMLLMIAYHTATTSNVPMSSTSPLMCVDSIVEFVEAIMMASVETRNTVVDALSSWLTTSVSSGAGLILLQHAELQVLSTEISQGWLNASVERTRA